MACANCIGTERMFGQRRAHRDLRSLRKKGPSKSTKLMLEELTRRGVRGATVVDIGAGVGALHLSLLEGGAARAVDVDASAAYQDAARSEAQRRELGDRVTYVHGDYLDVADGLEPAEVVCLDRVICCYPDMPALVKKSATQSTRLYGVTVPVDRTWTRALVRVVNTAMFLVRNPFRAFVHPVRGIERIAEEAGQRKVFQERTGIWVTLLFERHRVSQG